MKKNKDRAAFLKQFRAARKLWRSGDRDGATASLNKLLHSAEQGGRQDEAILCKAQALEIDGKHEDALSILAEIAPESDLRGLMSFVCGTLNGRLALYDEAIRCFRQALDTPNYDTPADAWHNMGRAFDEKGDYDEAIRCYQQALDTPNYDTPGPTWKNMGWALYCKGDYDEAIRCYRQALDTPNSDTPGLTWNNMGVAFFRKGDHDEAIRCYQQALDTPNYATPAYAWHNMASAYEGSGNDSRALECWQSAAELYEKQGDHQRLAYVRKRIDALRVKPAERSGQDAAFLQESAQVSPDDSARISPADNMWAKIAQTEQTAYQTYAAQAGDEQPCVLAILKGWGSAVPIIQSDETGSRGGGYFLKWNGKGLVIDPGFDFLRNFHESGFHGREISAVAVTHNHSDHNQDLGLIEDLFYEMHKGAGEPDKAKWHYTMILDSDTFAANTSRFQPTSYRNTPMEFDHRPFEYKTYKPLKLQSIDGLPFLVHYFKTQHSSDVKKAVGIRVTCLNEDKSPGFTLGYSSDTGYFDGLCTDKCLGKDCDILIADVSQPDRAEKDEPDKLKPSHLGMNGLIKLVEGCSPKMTIISEYWSGLSDVRLEMARELRQYFKTDSIFPGGLGLYINPRDMTIRCSECKRYHPFQDTLIVRSRDQYGPLGYLCPDCRV